MRAVELQIRMPSKNQRRGRLVIGGQNVTRLWPFLLALLLLAYARKQPIVPTAPAPAPAAIAIPVQPAPQVAVTLTPRMPPPLPVELRRATPVPVRPAPPRATAPPSPAHVTPPINSQTLTPTPSPTSAGALTPVPAALMFDTTLVRSSNANQTTSEKNADGSVVIRSQTTMTSESEVEIVSRSVSISNSGAAPVKIGQAALAATAGRDFAIAGDSCSGNMLAPQAACGIAIRFRARNAGTYSSQLSVPSDAVTLAIPVTATVTLAGPAAK